MVPIRETRPKVTVSRLVCVVGEEAGAFRRRRRLPRRKKSTLTRDAAANSYYFHRFYEFQPDLNTSNPLVQAELLKIMGFWLQLGVSGFRMDAVPFVIATKGSDVHELVEQYEMLRTFREFLQWRQGEAIILAEANVLPDTDLNYFGRSGERLQMMFNFQVNQTLFYGLASGDSRPLVRAPKATAARPATAQWSQFLRNHDELDLGASLRSSVRPYSPRSARRRRCGSTTAASAAAWRRCCKATVVESSWPTA